MIQALKVIEELKSIRLKHQPGRHNQQTHAPKADVPFGTVPSNNTSFTEEFPHYGWKKGAIRGFEEPTEEDYANVEKAISDLKLPAELKQMHIALQIMPKDLLPGVARTSGSFLQISDAVVRSKEPPLDYASKAPSKLHGVLAHEFGHIILDNSGFDTRNAWADTFSSLDKSYLRQIHSKNPTEAFADAYAMYKYGDRSKLPPEALKFVESLGGKQ